MAPAYLSVDRKEKYTNQALEHSKIYNLKRLRQYANLLPVRRKITQMKTVFLGDESDLIKFWRV